MTDSYTAIANRIIDQSKKYKDTPFYYNRDNKKVEIEISEHAQNRFKERFVKLFCEELKVFKKRVDLELNALIWTFNHASRSKKLNSTLKDRIKRHGQNTMFFIYGPFRLVVQNKILVTVEIRGENKDLN